MNILKGGEMGKKWTIDRCYEHEGEQYGRLTVIYTEMSQQYGKSRLTAFCKCSCGKTAFVCFHDMKSNKTRSCGCWGIENRIKHGHSTIKTYDVWKAMRQRVHNSNHPSYCNYGSRGIKVCEEWEDFANFLKDMGECPKGLTIERINNDGDYEPQNCIWATRAEQMRNTRRTHFINVFGKQMCIADLVLLCHKSRSSIDNRLKQGWLIDDIIFTP